MSILSEAHRVVIKVGTSTLTHKTGMLNIRHIEWLVKTIADLKNSGKEIVLVTSGAIGVGAGKLSIKRPTDIPTKQACAAIGQCELMYVYDKYFSVYNHSVAQVLLTRDIIDDPHGKINVINTFKRLLELSVIPVVNENDTVSVEEIEDASRTFGDNDTLSAIVAKLVNADLLIILSDIDGLYDCDPRSNSSAKLISEVTDITPEIISIAGGKGSEFGTGGMITKLHAAGYCLKNDIPLILTNGSTPGVLYKLFDGENVGTLFKKAGGI